MISRLKNNKEKTVPYLIISSTCQALELSEVMETPGVSVGSSLKVVFLGAFFRRGNYPHDGSMGRGRIFNYYMNVVDFYLVN